MPEHVAESLPVLLLIVFTSAKLCSEIAERLGVPGLVGEILAGVVVGPSLLGWVKPSPALSDLAELGVLFLLFRVGLESRAPELWSLGRTAAVVAASGVALPLALGWGAMRLWGFGNLESLFVGAALVATSVGITAQVLSARGALQQTASQIILAAAVIDDVLGLIVLAAVSGVATGKSKIWEIVLTALLSLLLLVVLARFGHRTLRHAVPRLESAMRASESQFHLAMILLFGLSVLALWTGVAAIVGAFLAGISLGEAVERRVHTLVHGTTELLIPFFLVGIGARVEMSVFKDPSTLALTGVVLGIAVLSKLIGCGAGAWSLGRREALKVGCGMVPRGEVGMVVAQLGLTMSAVSSKVYGVVVFTALATTLVAPLLLSYAYREAPGKPSVRR